MGFLKVKENMVIIYLDNEKVRRDWINILM